jgi:hypothetical protein
MKNRALTLRELQAEYGLSYMRLRRLARLPGFPLIEGVVFEKDFDDWRKEYFRSRHTGEAPQLDAGRKVDELTRSSGSPAFGHLVQGLQLFAFWLLG